MQLVHVRAKKMGSVIPILTLPPIHHGTDCRRRHLPVRDRIEEFRLNKPGTTPTNADMKMHFPRLMAATLATCIA